ncbi:MAG: hypothetical protein K5925_05935 [Bacilli bacterium]|nr:hypothetical protein [Bacilli bacterium]
MKKIAKVGVSAVALFVLAACGQNPSGSTGYQREKDADVYARHLKGFEDLAFAAKEIKDDDQRFVAYAKAEAALLDSAVMNPTTTQGGNYALTRVAPRTIPYSMWGNDEDRIGQMVVVNAPNQFITLEQRNEMIELWKEARAGGDAYDPAAYLQGKGYTLATEYKTTFSTAPETIDVLNTSSQADTELLVNLIDGLVQYNNLGELHGNLAVEKNGLPYELSEDGLTYTFEIRSGAKWYDKTGAVYADVTADDFVAGFQHMLDAAAGLDYLVDGIVEGVSEYLYDGGSFEDVGVKANGNKLSFKLVKEESFFPTRLTYSCFMPMNRQFFVAHGGKFGLAEYKEAAKSSSFNYGKASDLTTMVYNGAYLPEKLVSDSEIVINKNANYFNKDAIRLNKISWIKDAGENPEQTWNSVVNGTYAAIGLGESSGNLKRAKEQPSSAPAGEKYFDTCAYITDTTSTTYMAGYNLNRGTYSVNSVVSSQTDAQKEQTHKAMNNKNFRKALAHAWDRGAYNAVSVGEDLKLASIRNTYTAPDFVSLSKQVTDGDKVFAKGTTYGELIEYYLKNVYNSPIKTADGQDGWFNVEYAKQCLNKAIEELGEEFFATPVIIDVVYYGASTAQTSQAQGYKKLIEGALNIAADKAKGIAAKNYVEVRLLNASTTNDFYACGYRAADGKSGCFDVFYGSGWGPDYGDPSTYLDTFLGDGAGYMTKIVGLF